MGKKGKGSSITMYKEHMDIVPSLHPWDESHLVMVYDLFNVLLDAVCQYFVENFSIYVHQ